MIYNHDQLTPWFRCGSQNPVRAGWYLLMCYDDEFAQSTPSKTPKFHFENTVWRYWDGSKWMWHGPESFTPMRLMATAKKDWHDADTVGGLWCGLKETFNFKIA